MTEKGWGQADSVYGVSSPVVRDAGAGTEKETAEEMNGNAQRKWEMGSHLDLPALGSWVRMEG